METYSRIGWINLLPHLCRSKCLLPRFSSRSLLRTSVGYENMAAVELCATCLTLGMRCSQAKASFLRAVLVSRQGLKKKASWQQWIM